MILDRKEAIAAKQDPFGKVWGVRPENNELAFWVAGTRNAENVLVIPAVYPTAELDGKWTKPPLAEQAIVAYLEQAWDMADDASKKQAGKARAKTSTPTITAEESQAIV